MRTRYMESMICPNSRASLNQIWFILHYKNTKKCGGPRHDEHVGPTRTPPRGVPSPPPITPQVSNKPQNITIETSTPDNTARNPPESSITQKLN
ncbi:hypothetical protein VNO77_20823 [Canavalia gladiata]|uniref:Uncharacterized protein n=1 Tax=Canavalia gladiata TaxID=3824 RepID=A0AAN9QLK5_CANGL